MGSPEDIAIVGMAATFAGAPDVGTYWANIMGKVDAVADAPPGWIGDESIFDVDAPADGLHIYTRRGGFLGDLARFDPRPSGTMPVALNGAEPDQFLALKAAVNALADAGYAKRDFARERTGIILGHGIHANRGSVNGVQQGLIVTQTVNMLRAAFPELTADRSKAIEAMLTAKLPVLNVDTVPGLVPNMMTGRIANRLDLMGPNYIIDAACASSLLAVECAITELRTGRADMMLAGGINTTTSTLVYMVFCKLGALSRRSRVRPFDAGADGTLLGEGQGIVVLKRLADAQRDDDHIYAVIKGTGASSDGRAMGLMAPRLEGEILAMRRAYESSGIDPATVGLVETHGTGIPLGDELEIRALTSVMGERRARMPDVAIGSVKSMIGHCIPAAGMASVIKMALSLDQKILPPTLADEINPALGLERTPFFLNTQTMPWLHRRDAPRRAGVNAFGFGGINTHMVLEEAPGTGAAPTATFGMRSPRHSELFLLAGDTREQLVAAARNLSDRAAATGGPSLRALAVESAGSLGGGPHRLAVIATDAASLRGKLLRAIEKVANPDTHRLRGRDGVFFADDPVGGKVAFIFPGENSQYPGMLSDLVMASPLARAWFDRLEGLFHGERDVPHRLMMFPPALGLSEAEREELDDWLRRVDCGSEAVFFADMALFTVLRALGVRPDFIVGHSTGENAAVIASGLVKATTDAVGDYIRRMNLIFRDIEKDKLVPTGTLLAIGAADRRAIDQLLEQHSDLHLTMDNCPNQVILFGATALMVQIEGQLSAAGAICTALPMSWAYHTAFVAPMAERFASMLTDEDIGVPLAPVYSCASAGPFPAEPAAVRALLRDQYVSRVRFNETIRRLHDDGARIFVEVGPGSTLTGFIGDVLRGKPHLAVASDSSRGSSLDQFLALVGQLFINRVPVDPAPLYTANTLASPAQPEGPVLESALPFIHLSPAEGLQLRALLVGAPAAAAPAVSPAAPAAALPAAEAPAMAATAKTMPMSVMPEAVAPWLGEHFQLMNDFLLNQDAVTRHAMEAQRYATPPVLSGWTARLPLPFPAAVEFISTGADLGDGAEPGAALANALAPVLGKSDMDYYERVIGPQGPFRQRDWLIGRAAARQAVTAWQSGNGGATMPDSPIGYDDEGRPMLASAMPGDAVFLSISHKDGIAVAAAADRPVGIDLERVSAVQDPDGVLRVAFSAEETALLADGCPLDARHVAIAWSAKEAVAKSLGQKMLGRERSFVMTAFDPANATIRIAHDGKAVDAFYAVEGDFVCTLAAPAAP